MHRKQKPQRRPLSKVSIRRECPCGGAGAGEGADGGAWLPELVPCQGEGTMLTPMGPFWEQGKLMLTHCLLWLPPCPQ